MVKRAMNKMASEENPIIRKLANGLRDLYGKRLRNLILFGSYARGDYDEDSDIDIAVVLDKFEYAGEEISNSSDIVAKICLENDCLIALVPIREMDWKSRKTPLLENIRKEGVLIEK